MRMNLEFVHFWKALRKSRGNCAFLEDVLNRMHVCLCSETQFEARVVCLKVVTCDLDRGSRTRVWKSVCVRALQRGSLVGSLKLASLYLVCCLVETEVNLGEKLSLWESFDLVLKLFGNPGLNLRSQPKLGPYTRSRLQPKVRTQVETERRFERRFESRFETRF